MYTLQDIRKLEPCYDPAKYLAEDWTGTLADILRVKACPAEDRIWVVTKLLDDKTNRLFAVWCAREALKLIKEPDQRSITACDVAERYAHGDATDMELEAARGAACTAADAAAGAAAGAAWSASWAAWATADAARAAAARAAAARAADAAADAARGAAARAAGAAWAAWSAASAWAAWSAESAWSAWAAWSAWSAASAWAAWSAESAWSAACATARQVQINKLIEMVEVA